MMEAFDLYSPEIDADPFPYYEILREQYPCYWSESGKLWLLKGEAKSAANLNQSTITRAREVLNRDNGRGAVIAGEFRRPLKQLSRAAPLPL